MVYFLCVVFSGVVWSQLFSFLISGLILLMKISLLCMCLPRDEHPHNFLQPHIDKSFDDDWQMKWEHIVEGNEFFGVRAQATREWAW